MSSSLHHPVAGSNPTSYFLVPEENETYLSSGLTHKYIHTIGWKRITIHAIKH